MFLLYFLSFLGLSASICPTGTLPSFSNPKLCYYFGIQNLQYMQAEEQCRILNGHLATTHSIEEDIYLSQIAGLNFRNISVKDVWFGANKMTGKWGWLDGSNFNFTDWDIISNPQSQTRNICGAISTMNGKWIAQDCYKFKPFICEFFVEETITTPSTPSTTPTTTTDSTISTSTSSIAPDKCSTGLKQTCGELLKERSKRICSIDQSKKPYDWCSDRTLEEMCCDNPCTDCQIKECRCPKSSK